MDLSPDELFALLLRRVAEDKPHTDYKRTVDHANWCYQMVTGDEQREILVTYKVRETQKQVDQRVRITNSRTQYVCNKVKKLYNEVHRCDDVTESISYLSSNNADLIGLQDALNVFYENKPLDKYIAGRFKDLVFEDPNAYIITEFENDDPINKKPTVYPFEVRASEVYDTKHLNGVLKYLISFHPITYPTTRKGTVIGHRFTMYGIGYSFVLQHIPKDAIFEMLEGWDTISIKVDKETRNYIWKGFESKTTECPAFRVGYSDDPTTQGRTKVSPFYPAEKIITDLIWNKSEYDLSKALHGFYQKFVYVDKCEACTGEGHLLDREREGHYVACTSCKGTGKDIHSTVQDVVMFDMPQDGSTPVPLSNLIHFAAIPDALIKMQREDFISDQRDVFNAIFGANVLDRSEIVETATAKNYDWRAVNNTLFEYADNVDEFYKFSVRTTANHRGEANGLVVQRSSPSDFKLETIQDLIDQRSSAAMAGVPMSVITTIDMAILGKQHKDDPDFIKNYKAWERFKPMRDKSKDEKMILLSTLPSDDSEKVLYTYYDRIMADIFDEVPNFADMDYKRQKAIVYAKVSEITALKARPNLNSVLNFAMDAQEPVQP